MARLAIHGVRLFDGVHLRDGLFTVTIRDHEIEALRPTGDISGAELAAIREDCRVIDGGGATLLPGLIDLHTHLTWSAGAMPVELLTLESPERTLLRAVHHAGLTLRAGITTVRDVGSLHDLAIDVGRAVDDHLIAGPRVVASGRPIIKTGGHDPFWGCMIDGPYEARKAVRQQMFRGAGVIKVSATGGAYGKAIGETVDGVELLPDELVEITSQAHDAGIKVAAHAIGHRGIQNCIDTGVDTIEHGQFLSEDQAAAMAEKGMALVPTLFVYRTLAEAPEVPAYAREKAKAIIGRHREALAMARAAGVPIGTGTDAGAVATPHPCLVDEIAYLADYGLAPEEALAAATSTGAAILGMGDRLGTVEEGKIADLILVNGNPCEDFEVLRHPSVVVQGGEIVFATP